MRVLVTGAGGFIGRALVRRLCEKGRLGPRTIERLTLLDLHPGTLPAAPFAVDAQPCDLADGAALARGLDGPPIDVVFHLASIPGGTAEQQYGLARHVNLDATLALLERGQAQVEAGGPAPLFVFASSIAVFGALPAQVDDQTLPQPHMTYGAHKLIGETLVADFSRRGWVDGRSLRLPGVLARPPARTGQLSAFLSDLIRELAAGRPFVCPTTPEASTWASSLPCVLDQLLHAATLAPWPSAQRTLTLPTRHFTMAELVDAVAAVHGPQVLAGIRFAPDERIQALFGRFPPLATPAAEALGFRPDPDLPSLVRRALASH